MPDGPGAPENQDIGTISVRDKQPPDAPAAITAPLAKEPKAEPEKPESLVLPNPESVPQNIKEILDQGALAINFNLSKDPIIKELGMTDSEINKGYGTHINRNCSRAMLGNWLVGYPMAAGHLDLDFLPIKSIIPPYGLLLVSKMPLSEEWATKKVKIEHKKVLGIKLPIKKPVEASRIISVPRSSGEYINGLKSKDPLLSSEPLVIVSAFIHTTEMSDDFGRNAGFLCISVGLPETLYKKLEGDIHESPALVLDYARELYPIWYKNYIVSEENKTGIKYRDSIIPTFEIGSYSNAATIRELAHNLKEKSK